MSLSCTRNHGKCWSRVLLNSVISWNPKVILMRRKGADGSFNLSRSSSPKESYDFHDQNRSIKIKQANAHARNKGKLTTTLGQTIKLDGASKDINVNICQSQSEMAQSFVEYTKPKADRTFEVDKELSQSAHDGYDQNDVGAVGGTSPPLSNNKELDLSSFIFN